MGRTNVVVDDALIEKVMRKYGLKTKRAAIDYALRRLMGEKSQRDLIDLKGRGWDGDLDAMRMDRIAELWGNQET